ncbi:hypothetical protein [Portibacter lacus]|uniref:Phosphate/sulfate permease n=1 Tax=Portibacter lacus TaxID=1099794 RepID=A0AA37SMZ9_9BACT|nr:hypothetical protein [Portibacter lacus]GLR16309.1 hypothetical protein GCM10007940_09240 [Portibacter lacus]
MDFTSLLMWTGFILASFSVIGNDVIQTLGTFMSSNEKKPWWVLFIFAGSILAITLVYSWVVNNGDVSFLRLIGDPPDHSFENPKYPLPDPFEWYYLLPPLVLLFVTRWGIPVSTSFLILTFFKPRGLEDMMVKSLIGYAVAFGTAILVYVLITKRFEKKFMENPVDRKHRQMWTVLQWLSTGFLWTQWLAQDFANIYVYLPRQLGVTSLVISLLILLAMLAFIFYVKGGAIQNIVKSKTNTADIRSATIIDFIYGIVLFFFKEMNNIPMSTTWVFIGLLAGREIAIRWRLDNKLTKREIKGVLIDLLKVTFGLVISIILVFFIRWITG